MEFIQVDYNALQIGKKYMVRPYVKEVYYETMPCTFIGYVLYRNNAYFKCKHTSDIFKSVFQLDKIFQFEKLSQFYELISIKERVQYSMELRAIHTILRQITGDDTFNY